MTQDTSSAAPANDHPYKGILSAISVLQRMESRHQDYQAQFSKVEMEFDGGDDKLSLQVASEIVRARAYAFLAEEVEKKKKRDHTNEYPTVQGAVAELVSDEKLSIPENRIDLDPRGPHTPTLRLEEMKEFAKDFLENSCLTETRYQKRLQMSLLQELTHICFGLPKSCQAIESKADEALQRFIWSDQTPEDAEVLGGEIHGIIDHHLKSKVTINTANRRELEFYCLGQEMDEVLLHVANQALDDLLAENPTPSLTEAISRCEWTLNHAWTILDDAEFARTGRFDIPPNLESVVGAKYAGRATAEMSLNSRGEYPWEETDGPTLTEQLFDKKDAFAARMSAIAKQVGVELTTGSDLNARHVTFVDTTSLDNTRRWQAAREKATLFMHNCAKERVSDETLERLITFDAPESLIALDDEKLELIRKESLERWSRYLKPADELTRSAQLARERRTTDTSQPQEEPKVKKRFLPEAIGRFFG